MLGQIAQTPYDLRLRVAGIPVRVHPIFWLTALIIAWVPGRPGTTLVRMLCIFLAVLVHELGHAAVTRRFGWRPEIVLYFFGGYATTVRHSTWKDIAVLAAGPGAGFLLYFAFLALDASMGRSGGSGHRLLLDAIQFSLWINLAWNLMNLLPVLPLDGGQICREYLAWLRPRGGRALSTKVSVATAGVVVVLALVAIQKRQGLLGLDPLFVAIMFGYLAYEGVTELRRFSGRS